MTPSPNSTLSDINLSTESIIYRLGSINTSLENIQSNITQSILRLENKLVDSAAATSKEITMLTVRLENSERKVNKLEDWKNQLFTKLGFVVSAISLFWVIFAEPIKKSIEGYFG